MNALISERGNSHMPIKTRRFLSEQLQLVLDEMNGMYPMDSEFLREHLGSINEHGSRLVDILPHSCITTQVVTSAVIAADSGSSPSGR